MLGSRLLLAQVVWSSRGLHCELVCLAMPQQTMTAVVVVWIGAQA